MSCIALYILFSIFTLSFNADVSLTAFPLCALFTALFFFFALKKVFIEKNTSAVKALRLFLQYAPYVFLVAFVLRRAGENGTPYFVDLISVLLWCAFSACGLVILYFINPRRVNKISPEWASVLGKKTSGNNFIRKICFEVLSWIDALVQAVFMVLLINIFIVQLYEIPSESMVPEFLIGDRVVVFKTASGPKFPLSEIGLPYVNSYDRGDIVVFRNPHYENDRKSEVRTFISQIVYMCSLTTVNLNVDEKGKPIADPLVKRITGLPGEQLMMQDGTLYSRTKDSPEFKPVEADNTWACWDLNKVREPLKDGIREYVFTDYYYDNMLLLEKNRRELDLADAKKQCLQIASQLEKYFVGERKYSGSDFDFSNERLCVVGPVYDPSDGCLHGTYSFERSGEVISTQNLAAFLAESCLYSREGLKWFCNFMRSPFENETDFGDDLYSEANYRLNVMAKLNLGKMVLRGVGVIIREGNTHPVSQDKLVWGYSLQTKSILDYIWLLDLRNMPVFPANNEDGTASYIPEDNYFMMGDNRFNSLDMRHSYDAKIVELSKADPNSLMYLSDIAPQYVPEEKILGTTSYRFWPWSRHGVPGHTGM